MGRKEQGRGRRCEGEGSWGGRRKEEGERGDLNWWVVLGLGRNCDIGFHLPTAALAVVRMSVMVKGPWGGMNPSVWSLRRQ